MSVLVVSVNTNRSKAFRAKAHSLKNSSRLEVAYILQSTLKAEHWQDESGLYRQRDEEELTDNNAAVDKEVSREDLEVKAKLFLIDYSASQASLAVNAALSILDFKHLDSLQLSVPVSGRQQLQIASQPKDKDEAYEAQLGQLRSLWKELSQQLVGEDKRVRAMGVCDVETMTLKALVEDAEEGNISGRPYSISVGMESCCVVPEDMTTFCSAHSIRVLTHKDDDVVLSPEVFQDLTLDDSELQAGLRPVWVLRYQSMIKKRGVIREKRYIVGFEKK